MTSLYAKIEVCMEIFFSNPRLFFVYLEVTAGRCVTRRDFSTENAITYLIIICNP